MPISFDAKPFSLLLLPICASFLGGPAAAVEQTAPVEYSFIQHFPSVTEFGTCNVLLTQHAAKVHSKSAGCDLLFSAKESKVYYYRTSEKKMWVGKPEEFNVNRIDAPFGKLFIPPNSKKFSPDNSTREKITQEGKNQLHISGTKSCAGLQCTAYLARDSYRDYSFLAADTIEVDPAVARFMARLAKMPDSGHFPVYCRSRKRNAESAYRKDFEQKKANKIYWNIVDLEMRDDRGGPIETLRTDSAKIGPFHAKDFLPPTNFTRVDNLSDVSYSRSKIDAINEAFK